MHKERGGHSACTCVWGRVGVRSELTGVGIGVAVGFGPLIRGGLLVEVVLRLHQRERLCEEGATAYRLVVSQTAVTAALLGAVRQVKRDAPLRLEPRAQNRASDVSAPLCLCAPATPSFPPPARHCTPRPHPAASPRPTSRRSPLKVRPESAGMMSRSIRGEGAQK